MKDHLLVHFDFIFFSYLFYEVYVLLSDSSIKITILRVINLVIPYVVVCGTIARSRNKVIMLRISLIWSSIIYTLADYTPSHIPIRYFSFEKRTACCQCKKNRTDDIQLIVDVSRMIKVFSRKCALQAARPHSKSHCIHMNESFLWFCFIDFI